MKVDFSNLTREQETAVIEMALSILSSRNRVGETLTSPHLTRQWLMLEHGEKHYEVFSCLFLNNQHQILAYEEMFFGTINSASVYPREVVKRSLEVNAAAVIFCHNHPSGLTEPSKGDCNITERLRDALMFFDIRVLDHIIVGSQGTVSLAERGLI